MEETFMLMILYAVVALLSFLCNKAFKALSEEFERLAACHNRLCELTRSICESLNKAGIGAPQERKTNNG